jgi:putative ABC transport system permease protein
VRNVPLARRNLFAERRRAALGIIGVAVAVLMVLALDGIFTGTTRQLTRYIDTSQAEVFVAQRGVGNMHMATSSLPVTDILPIRELPEVAWADPLAYVLDAVVGPRGRQNTYLIGYPIGGHGGPAELVGGREPGHGEIVLDDRSAENLDVGIGDRVETAGRSWRVSGLTTGMTVITNSFAYMPYADLADASGQTGITNYVVVGAKGAPEATANAIRVATGLEVLTKPAFSAQEARIVRDMSTELMGIMTLAAFVIGLAVTGLTLYAATLSRLREIGVMKALGAGWLRLARDVTTQAAWTVGSGVALAIPAAFGLAWVIERITPTVSMFIGISSIGRAAAGVVALGALGAAIPLIKVAHVDPATVFGRTA